MEDFKKYKEMVETTLDMDRVETAHEYYIKPQFDETLRGLFQIREFSIVFDQF